MADRYVASKTLPTMQGNALHSDIPTISERGKPMSRSASALT